MLVERWLRLMGGGWGGSEFGTDMCLSAVG
jgi:hypothetical protein